MIRFKYKKTIAVALTVCTLSLVGVFFINASAPPTQSFRNPLPYSNQLFSDLEQDIKLNRGLVGTYVRNHQLDFDLAVANKVAGNTDGLTTIIAAEQVRVEWVYQKFELSSMYLEPLDAALRRELVSFGFVLEARNPAEPYTIRIVAAVNEAAHTPMGGNVNRYFQKYGHVATLDPKWSLDPEHGAVGEVMTDKRVLISMRSVLGAEPGDWENISLKNARDLQMTMLHEEIHVRNRYRMLNGILDLEAGVFLGSMTNKYMKGSYGEAGFFGEEAAAWALSLRGPDSMTPRNLTWAHGMAAASLESKITIYSNLGTGFVKKVAASSLATVPGFEGAAPYFVGIRGTAVATGQALNASGQLILGDSAVFIANKDPATITDAEIKDYLRQSIGRSIAAMERIAQKLEFAKATNKITIEQYNLTAAAFEIHRTLIDAEVLGISTTRAGMPHGPIDEIFGIRLASAPSLAKVAYSPVVRQIEQYFGSAGLPQKVAAFNSALDTLKAAGMDLSKPFSADGAAVPAAAVTELQHLDRVLDHKFTGEVYTNAEIASMPNADLSRKAQETLGKALKITNRLGFAMLGAAAVQAVANKNLAGFILDTGMGFVEFYAGMVALRLIVGPAIANPVGAVYMIGDTVYAIADMTSTAFAYDIASFFNWMRGRGALTGVQLSSYAKAALQIYEDDYQAALLQSSLVANYRSTLPVTRTLTGPPPAATTAEDVLPTLLTQVGASGYDTDPSPAISFNYFSTANPANSAPPNVAPVVDAVITQRPKVQIKLRYVCSAWTFVTTDPNSTNIPASNQTACNNFAAAATAYTQSVFDRSDLPVQFTSSAEVESATPYGPLQSNFTLNSGQTPTSIMNTANGIASMPAIQVTNTYYALQADPSGTTCNPFASNCGSTTSTANVNYYQLKFGVASPTEQCGGVCTPTQSYNASAPTNRCSFDCHCAYYYGTQSDWNSSCVSQYGAWQGPGLQYTGRNACGCVISYITSKPGIPKSYSAKDSNSARNWVKTHYPSAAGTWTVTIAVMPTASAATAGGVETGARGSTTAIFDAYTGAILTETGVNFGTVTPSNLFSNYGYMSVNISSAVAGQTVAHQVGHLLGGVHERSTWGSNTFYTSSGANLLAREPAAFDRPAGVVNGVSVTQGLSIMHSNVSNLTVPQFSSDIQLLGEPGVFGSSTANNRNQIIRSLMYISNRQIVERPTGLGFNGTYGQTTAPPSLGAPEPAIDFAGGVSSSYAIGQGGTIRFFASSLFPIISATCSLDGQAAVPCNSLNSFDLPTSLGAGNHVLTVTVTDAAGGSTTFSTDPFFIDPSAVISAINAILLGD